MSSSIYDDAPEAFKTTRDYFFSKDGIRKAVGERDRLNRERNLGLQEVKLEAFFDGKWQPMPSLYRADSLDSVAELSYDHYRNFLVRLGLPVHGEIAKRSGYFPIEIGAVPPPIPKAEEKPTRDILNRFKATRDFFKSPDGVWPIVEATLNSAKIPAVDKVVGFGCGTMRHDSDGSLHSLHSTAQHLLVLELAKYFGANDKCFVQDPIYDEADKEVFRTEGMTVLDDPQGFLEQDDGSAVFSCCPNVPVQQIVFDVSKPAMMIWNDGDNRIFEENQC